MNVDQYFILLQAAHLIPIGIALIRYSVIDPSYRPFIFLLVLGVVNETINYLSIKLFGSNAVSFNVFHIVECLVLLYQFRIWNFFRSNRFFQVLVSAAVIASFSENFLFSSITVFNPYFRIFYAFLIELIIANRIIYIVNERTSVVKNARFIICVGLIIVFIYQIVFEGALMADPGLGETSSKLIIKLMGFTDVFVQLLYASALIVAPPKPVLQLTDSDQESD